MSPLPPAGSYVDAALGLGDEHDQASTVPAAPAGAPRIQGEPLTGKPILAYCADVVGDVFKALADQTRRAILDELIDRNGQTLFEICSRLAVKHGLASSRQAISQHLDVLEAAGLVTTRREGRYKFHDVDTSPLKVIVERWPIEDRQSRED
jgi:DNA-binding transcriptional ArsR family regulator